MDKSGGDFGTVEGEVIELKSEFEVTTSVPAMKPPRLSHINLLAKDPQALAQWYANMLGYKIEGSVVREPGALIVFEPSEPARFAGNMPFGFETESREDVEAWAIKFEAKVESDQTYAGFKAEDPEGNRFEIYWEERR